MAQARVHPAPQQALRVPAIVTNYQRQMLTGNGVFSVAASSLSQRDQAGYAAAKRSLIEPCRVVAAALPDLRPETIHKANAHVLPATLQGIQRLLSVPVTPYRCWACDVITEKPEITNSDPEWTTKFMFLDCIEVTTFVSSAAKGCVALHVLDRCTNYGWYEFVRRGQQVADSLIRLLDHISHITGRHPRHLVLTTKHGIHLDDVADPVRRYLDRYGITYLHDIPQMRIAFIGDSPTQKFIDYLCRCIAVLHTHEWEANLTQIFSTLNRILDCDGITPTARMYQKVDARANLSYRASYVISTRGVGRVAEFLGYAPDGVSYTFKHPAGGHIDVQQVSSTMYRAAAENTYHPRHADDRADQQVRDRSRRRGGQRDHRANNDVPAPRTPPNEPMDHDSPESGEIRDDESNDAQEDAEHRYVPEHPMIQRQRAADPPAPVQQQVPEVALGREVEREEQRRRREQEMQRAADEAAIQQMVIDEQQEIAERLYEEELQVDDHQEPGPSRLSWAALQEEDENRADAESEAAKSGGAVREETPETQAARELIDERIDQMLAGETSANAADNEENEQDLDVLFQRPTENTDADEGRV